MQRDYRQRQQQFFLGQFALWDLESPLLPSTCAHLCGGHRLVACDLFPHLRTPVLVMMPRPRAGLAADSSWPPSAVAFQLAVGGWRRLRAFRSGAVAQHPARYLSRLQTIPWFHVAFRGITACTVDERPAGRETRLAAVPARRDRARERGRTLDACSTCMRNHLRGTEDRFPETGPRARPAVFSRVDTALEAFRRNPTDGSHAPTPARASAEPNVRTCHSSRTGQDYYRNDCRRKGGSIALRMCTLRICSRPRTSGSGTTT